MSKLSPEQDLQIAELLAEGKLPGEVAKALGVHRSTVHRRLDDQAFMAQVAQLRERVVSVILGGLTGRALSAVVVLSAAMSCGDLSAEQYRGWRVRLSAAIAALSARQTLAEEHELRSAIRELQDMARRGLPPFGGQAQ